MGKEEDKKFETDYIEQRQRGFEVDVDLDDVREALNSGIAHGRATPDREMLIRLIRVASSWYSPEEIDAMLDQFLQSDAFAIKESK